LEFGSALELETLVDFGSTVKLMRMDFGLIVEMMNPNELDLDVELVNLVESRLYEQEEK
jgi:hypothetical protein